MTPLLRRAALPLALLLATATALPVQGRAEDVGAYLAGRQAQISGDFTQAATYLSRALRRDPDNAALLDATLTAWLAVGDIDRAAAIGRQLVTSGSNSQAGALVLQGVAAQDGDWQPLLDDIEDGQSVGPLFDGLMRGWTLIGAGRADEALAAFDGVAQQTGVRPFGIYHKALALAALGRFDEAEAALAAEPDLRLSRRGTIARVEILSQAGRGDDAAALLAETFGSDLDAELEQLRDRLAAGETLPFTIAPDATAGVGEIYFTIAGALAGESPAGYTLLYVRMALHLAPENIDALLLAASLLETMEQYDLAIDTYRKIPRDHPSFDAAELGRAEAMRAAGRTDAAIEVLRQLSDLRPDVPSILVTLGDTLRGEERFEEARAAYDRAIATFDSEQAGQWIVYFSRAITHERTGDFDAAERDFRTALRLNPDQPQVLNYLGYSYIEKNRNLDEALDMIQRAVAARPDSGYIIDSLGWAYYKLGRYQEAVEPMERAVALMPIDPVLNDHLGDVLWAVGRKLEAQFQWRRALSFAEDDAADVTQDLNPDRIRRKLDVGLDQVLADEGAAPLTVADDG